MSDKSLESIVPPLELCKRIPASRHFYESALVWHTFNKGRADEYTIVMFRQDYDEDVPAPTLAEILAELPEGVQIRMRTAKNRKRVYQVYHYAHAHWTTKATSEALRMWLRGKGIEVKA